MHYVISKNYVLRPFTSKRQFKTYPPQSVTRRTWSHQVHYLLHSLNPKRGRIDFYFFIFFSVNFVTQLRLDAVLRIIQYTYLY